MNKEIIAGLNFKEDLQEITSFIEEYIDTKYLSQIHNQINSYKRQCQEKPCKEVELLKAIVPFVRNEDKDRLSSLIEMVGYAKTIETMIPNYNGNTLFLRDSGQSESNEVNEYIHQAVLALFLYKAILWAEQYK